MLELFGSGRTLKNAQIMYSLMLTAGLMYLLIAYLLVPNVIGGIFDPADPDFQLIEIALAVVAVITLLLGAGFPSVLTRFMRGSGNASADALNFIIVRASLFEAIGIYGLILAVLGAEVYISLPFILVSMAALVLTFPNRERWRKIGGENDDQPGRTF
jgi:hypothetical protein